MNYESSRVIDLECSDTEDLIITEEIKAEEIKAEILINEVLDEVVDVKKPAKKKRKTRERKPIPLVKILTFEDVNKNKFLLGVDAFNFCPHKDIDSYFLTHFHSDHYYGITKNWNNGQIFATETTCNLLHLQFKINKDILNSMKFEITYELQHNLFMTFIHANHCPGSAIILFEFVTGIKTQQLKDDNNDEVHQEELNFPSKASFNIKEDNFLNPNTSLNNRRYIRANENMGVKVFRTLHCGDFRICEKMIMNPLIINHKIDNLYLDTTYFNPRYSFPGQESVVKSFATFAVDLLEGEVYKKLNLNSNVLFFQQRVTDYFKEIIPTSPKKQNKGEPLGFNIFKHNYLICIGTYTVGKEKVAIELAKRLSLKIYANHGKRRIFDTFEDEEFKSMITDDPFSTNIHLISMRFLQSTSKLEEYYKPLKKTFKNIIGVKPTGWTLRSNPTFSTKELREFTEKKILDLTVKNKISRLLDPNELINQFKTDKVIQVYEIPYSEHSSFRELCMFLILVDVDRTIPTVNLHNPESIRAMENWISLCKTYKKENYLTIEDF